MQSISTKKGMNSDHTPVFLRVKTSTQSTGQNSSLSNILVYDQVLATLMTFPSAAAVIYVVVM